MCECEIPQEESSVVLAVGQKVRLDGKECVITSIRVWHDLATYLGAPHRALPVFDVKGQGWSQMNVRIDELALWKPEPQIPAVPPQAGRVEG